MKVEKFNKNYDVFHAFLVENADYDGRIELPVLRTSSLIPDRVISFSEAMAQCRTNYDGRVHFYEHDKNFERLWNNPKKLHTTLKEI